MIGSKRPLDNVHVPEHGFDPVAHQQDFWDFFKRFSTSQEEKIKMKNLKPFTKTKPMLDHSDSTDRDNKNKKRNVMEKPSQQSKIN